MMLGDHPAVARALREGLRPGRYPRCPVCGAEPEVFYFDADHVCRGCEECMTRREYWEVFGFGCIS